MSVEFITGASKYVFTNEGKGDITLSAGKGERLLINKSVNYTEVNQLSDFPTPVAGVITLTENTNWLICDKIDILDNRLVLEDGVNLTGFSPATCEIYSSTSINDLITSSGSLFIKYLTLSNQNGEILNLTSVGGGSLDFQSVNFGSLDIQAVRLGTINNYENSIFFNCGFFNFLDGLTFSGADVATISFNQCIFSSEMTGLSSYIYIDPSLVVSRRFRIIYSSIVCLNTNIGITFDPASNVQSFILDTVNFSGSGTYLDGINYLADIAEFTKNTGIINSSSLCNYYMIGNTTETVINTIDTYTKIAGTTADSAITQKFEHTNNRATYQGLFEDTFKITSVISATSGNNQDLYYAVFKNGTLLPGSEILRTTSGVGDAGVITIQTIALLSENDYIEVFAKNQTSTANITVGDLNLIVSKV